jgi:hypothetical protein
MDAHQIRHVLERVVCALCVLRGLKIVKYKQYTIATRGLVCGRIHIAPVPQLPVLQALRKLPLVAPVIIQFYGTTLATPSLGFAQVLLDISRLLFLEANGVPERSVSLVAVNPSVVRGEWGMAEQASHDVSHLHYSLLLQPLLHAGHTYPLAIASVSFVVT